MKLLVVNLQNPNETKYHNPEDIDAFMLGRRLSNYPMFSVSKNGEMKQIVLESADIVEIKKQVIEQLNNYKPVTLQEANVGDHLEDGSIVLQKENGLALLIAPQSTEVECTWSQEFPEVDAKLQEQGFNSSQWFIPTRKQLSLAYDRLKSEFSSTCYWSSTELNATCAYFVSFINGGANDCSKALFSCCVRAFRCVTY